MFDIGFPELVVISIVALLVIGPEKLPETIRTLSLWIGRIQRSFSNIRREIENEIGADEIRQQLHNESIMKELDGARQSINDIHKDVTKTIEDTQKKAKSLATFKDPDAIIDNLAVAVKEDLPAGSHEGSDPLPPDTAADPDVSKSPAGSKT